MTILVKLGPTVVLLLLLTRVAAVRAEDWPQWRGPNRNGEWSESGIFETFPPNGLKMSWRAPVGIGFSSPVVADGRVFVTDSELAKPKASERVHAFEAVTGQKLWSHSYDVNYPDGAFDERSLRGPIATPVVNDGRIYTLGASGKVFSLEAVKGDVLWQKDLKQEYPESDLYPSPSPLIEGDLLILLVGAKPGASVVAFNKNTGELVWKALDEEASASSPIVVSAAGKRQLIVWTPQSVTSLNPATGTTYWRQRLNTTQDATVSTPVCYNGNLLIGGLMLKLDSEKPGATVLWPKSRATARRILSDTSTAMFRDAYIYSARSSGEFVCLEASTGNQLWETDKVTDLKSGASIHVTANGDSALLYSDQGDLIRTQLTAQGYHEISRARVLEPAVTFSGRKTAWAAPAFANQCIYARTNKELVCVSLAAEP
jgi:outer membrane protein assembly factor BamB